MSEFPRLARMRAQRLHREAEIEMRVLASIFWPIITAIEDEREATDIRRIAAIEDTREAADIRRDPWWKRLVKRNPAGWEKAQ